MSISSPAVEDALKAIPSSCLGPGGAVAVLQYGSLLGQRIWGYADMAERISMTADTIMPICSISKQLFCALLLDLQRQPSAAMAANGDAKSQFSNKLAELLQPEITQGTGLTIDHLCNMHSGVRDYWALTTLWGVKPEDKFSIAKHGPLMIERLKSLHFKPGTEFSYSNTNFHILGRILEQVSQESLGDLLAQRIFEPAGMKTARMEADTSKLPRPCVGYEGDVQHGYRAALNRIEWAGDAGTIASLNDMIAYETYLDRCFLDPQSWYRATITPGAYANGTPAKYHYGLSHGVINEVSFVGHSGALRGFRLSRLQVPNSRISVIVMLNHEANAGLVAESILKHIFKAPDTSLPVVASSQSWTGNYLDHDTQLAISISKGAKEGELSISYSTSPEPIVVKESHRAESPSLTASIDGDNVIIHRLLGNRTLHGERLVKNNPPLGLPLLPGSSIAQKLTPDFIVT